MKSCDWRDLFDGQSGKRKKIHVGDQRHALRGRDARVVDHIYDIESKMKSIFKYRREKDVLLKADRNIAYGFVIKVMARVKRAGIDKLGMVTEPIEEKP